MESVNKRAVVMYSKQWGVDLTESTIGTWKSKYKGNCKCESCTVLLPIIALVAFYIAFHFN